MWIAAGRPGIVHEVIGSTNDEVRGLARNGAPHGTWVVAHRQTAGRGRLGRVWEGEASQMLALSVLLRPRLPAAQVPLLCLAAAEVVALLHPALRIKWPNDVLLPDGRKVAGILAEAEVEPEGMVVVLGIGINVGSAPPLPTAGALCEVDSSWTRPAVATHVVEGVLAWADRLAAEGSSGLVDAWTERCGMIGAHVRVGAVEGIAQGIDESGTLWLDRDGVRVPIRAGDVEIVRWGHP